LNDENSSGESFSTAGVREWYLYVKCCPGTPDLDFNFPCFTTHPRSELTYYDLSTEQIDLYVNKYCAKVAAICKEFQPDIIHTQHLWIAPYAALKTGIPYIITAHGTDLMGFKKDKRYHYFALEGANNAAKIITISRQVHNDVKELYNLHEEKLKLNPNGFDDDIFYPKNVNRKEFFKQIGSKNYSSRLVSFAGKFTDFKGIDILIKAARNITDEIPGIVFALAGDGQLMGTMKELTAELKLNNLFFLGHQTQQEVATLYSAADVSVVPSRIEPFGLVAIEALACGTPVVATKAGGLPDFINTKVGKLVEMNDPDALADAIIDELKLNTKNSKGPAAAVYAKENYSWHKTLKNVIETYEKTLRS